MFGWWGLGFGILFLLFGVFAVFFFPSSQYHQEKELATGGVIMGIVSLVVGAALVFM
jgi:hypothetical protein